MTICRRKETGEFEYLGCNGWGWELAPGVFVFNAGKAREMALCGEFIINGTSGVGFQAGFYGVSGLHKPLVIPNLRR